MIYQTIGRLVPKRIRQRYKQLLLYANIETDLDRFTGFIFSVGLGVGIIASALASHYGLPPVVAFLLSFLVVEFIIYVFLVLSGDKKAKAIENVLPDALQLMSSNIRAGLTVDKALLMAARPEFGPLQEEITRIGKETMAGRNLTDALQKTKTRVNSKNLNRAFDLIIDSYKSGGKLADLLDQTANDFREQQIIQKEVSASVLMYVFFIFIAIGFAAPMLFSMSSFLVKLLTTNMAMIAKELPQNFEAMKGQTVIPIPTGKVQISPDFVMMYSYVALAVSSVFGAIIMGLIMSGEERAGIKFIPILLLLSVGLFILGNLVLESMVGEMLLL